MRDVPHQSDFDAFAQRDFVSPAPAHVPGNAATLPPPPIPAPPTPLPPQPQDSQSEGFSSSAKWALVLVAGLVVVSLVLTASVFGRQVASLRTIENLSAGDCVEDHFETTTTSEGEFFEILFVSEVDCTERHAYETYAVSELWAEDESHPGVDRAFFVGESFCLDEFDDFVEADYFTSQYDFFAFVPTFASWESGDRNVRCLIGHADGRSTVTGTLAGAGERIDS